MQSTKYTGPRKLVDVMVKLAHFKKLQARQGPAVPQITVKYDILIKKPPSIFRYLR
jgi:hypothetical protein